MNNLSLSHNPHRRWLILVLLLAPLLFFGLIRLAGAAAVVSFTSQTSYNVGAGPFWTATFNKFGKPAIAVTNQDANSVSVLHGNYVNGQYDGTFGGATTYSLVTGAVTTPAPQQVVAGNLGQLSLPSLVIAAAGANKVAVLLGNSDDSFQAPVYYTVGTFPESVALGDVNSDGNLDIIAANYDSSTISVLLGNSDRTFQSQQTYGTSANPESIVIADFNNDGKVDVATVNSGTNPGKVNVLLNVNGTFPSAVTSDVGVAPFSLAVGDFNGDGRVDIVAANHSGGVSVLLNNGVRPFPAVAPAPVSAGSSPYSVAVADFNLDGQADIAVSNNDNGGSVGILPNNGGSFQALQASNTFSTGPSPLFIAVGDFNVDGRPDIVTPNHPIPVVNPGTISVLLNFSFPFSSSGPPPPNDNFSAAQNLNNAVSGRVTGTTIGATRENGEPIHVYFGGSTSIWYSWTATANGAVTFDTFGSSFNTVLAAYTGNSVSTLTSLASNEDDFSPGNDVRRSSRVRFRAEAGTTYRIAVADSVASSPTIGNVTLNWYLLPPPTNDLFANAETIAGSSVAIVTTNAGATKEAGEPNHGGNAGGASIWYRWIAPENNNFTVTTTGSRLGCAGCSYDTLLAVYTGSSLQQLSLVAQNDDNSNQVTSRVAFQAQTGTTYYIAVDSKGTAAGDISLTLLPTVLSANDTSANPVIISGFSGGSSTATGPTNGEAWFLWTAPGSGSASFTSQKFTFPPPPQGGFANDAPSVLTAFNVDGSGNPSTQITSGTGFCRAFSFIQCDPTTITFNVTATNRYFLRVKKNDLSSLGSASLTWSLTQATGPPANDNFANAISIGGITGSVNYTTSGATKEAGEPGDPNGHSVWYKWIAPANLSTTFETTSTVSVAVYTGSSVNALSPPLASGTGSATFAAVQGNTYRISLETLGGTAFTSLSWQPSTPPPNDNFANAQVLNTSSGSVLGHNVHATAETGEPNHAGVAPSTSIWYRWTAPSTGLFTFKKDESGSGRALAIYVGSSLSNLSPVSAALNEGFVTFFATAGTTFQIAVDGLSLTGSIVLSWGPTRTISGRIVDIRGTGIANIQVTLSGDASRSRTTDSQGKFFFSDLAQGGNYTVTPAINSFTFDFDNHSYSPLTTDITDSNFVAKTPTYFITGRLMKGQLALANIKVNLEGTDIPANTSVQTTANGNYTFSNLTINGDFKVTPSSAEYTFNATIFPAENSYSFKTLNQPINNADFSGTVVSRTLTVASINPANGVNILITPNDNGGQPGGLTPLTRVYDSGQTVNLSAPPTVGINTFQKWLRDGVDFSLSQGTSVLMDANHTMTAVYLTPTRTLTVASTNVAGGVNITVSPNDNNNQGGATTQFTRIYNLNTSPVTLTAPLNSGNSTFQKWQKDGADYSNSLTTNLTIDADHTMTAVYITTSSQTPTGQNVAVQLNGVTVTFNNVSTAGTTTIMPISPGSAGQLPNSYQLTGNSIAFDISTTAVVQPPISVCFNVPSITDAGAFAQLRILHNENGTLVDRTSSQDFATKTICANVNSLSPFVLASTNSAVLQLLLENIGVPNHAAALDALLFVRDPFAVINQQNLFNPAQDPNTRLLLFVRNLQLAPNETAADVTVNLVDSNNQNYDVTAEDVRVVLNTDFSQLRFRLPNTLASGACLVQIKVHGQVSYSTFIKIKP
jgi:hypothetical protein